MKKRIYAAYRGDAYIGEGMLDEIAKMAGARGREAARKIQRQKHGIELTQEGRLSLVYAFCYALKQRGGGLDNVRAALKPHLAEFRTGTLEHMVMDIDVHCASVAHIAERYSLARKEQEDFRAMLVREIERRKSDGADRR